MRHYEILTILPGTLAENEIPPVIEQIKAMITDEGVSSLAMEEGGKSRLAYPIKHIRYGYFHVFTFAAEAEIIKKIEVKLRLFGQILRTLIKTFDPQDQADSKKTLLSFLGINEEKIEKEQEKEVKKPFITEPAVLAQTKSDEKKIPQPSEEKPKEVSLQDVDKQLEALLDDKIAGL